MIIYFLVLFCLGYLIGSIPFGYIFGKVNHLDIRQYGSGNIGATNISRRFGIKGFLIVGILDFFKSYFFCLFIFSLPQISLFGKLILSLSPILGHIFSLFLNFKGGKGVSCTYGLLAAIFGWKFILIWLFVWLLILFISRLMSLTNLVLAISFPILFWIKFHSFASIVIGTVLTFVIIIAHKENIKKLIKGKENKI
ncbi:Glycerol-3-phosphate acyltransferase [bioreactor metagenome]|uniref:Glycerol-3-phosphate acyltransferase n=1 Tax=bioreactor metagenome TaxID=1076179 RepID=A0A645B271_9ZZZZ